MNLITFFVVAGAMGIGALLATQGEIGLGLSVWAVAVVVSQTLQMMTSRHTLSALKALKPQGVADLHSFSVRPASGSSAAPTDDRLQITPFGAEHARTLDEVAINVEAVVLWHMPDAQTASMSLEESQRAIALAAGVLLDATIRTSSLAVILSERESAIAQMCEDLAHKASAWGAVVHAVEVRRVSLPLALEAENDARLLLIIGARLAQHRLRKAAAALAGKLKNPRTPPLPRIAVELRRASPDALSAPLPLLISPAVHTAATHAP